MVPQSKRIPAGVNYLIGKGDLCKDWNYAQFPGTTGPFIFRWGLFRKAAADSSTLPWRAESPPPV